MRALSCSRRLCPCTHAGSQKRPAGVLLTAGGLICSGCCDRSHVRCITAAYGLSPCMDHLPSQRAISHAAPGDLGPRGLCPVRRPSPTDPASGETSPPGRMRLARAALAQDFESRHAAQAVPATLFYRSRSDAVKDFLVSVLTRRGRDRQPVYSVATTSCRLPVAQRATARPGCANDRASAIMPSMSYSAPFRRRHCAIGVAPFAGSTRLTRFILRSVAREPGEV